MSKSSDASFRARLRESSDSSAVCAELTGLASELGFQRSLVLLDERERGAFKVEAPHGYSEGHSFENIRLRGTDEAVARLVESTLSGAAAVHEISTSPILATFGLSRAIAIGLRDTSGAVGMILAGHADGGAPWPDAAPQTFRELLPDAIATLRHRILARVVVEDRAMLLAQKAEIEMLAGELRRRNDEMLDDLEQAREFQAQMLSKPPRVAGVQIHLAYRPLDAVSGDLVDVSYDGTKLRVFVSDTTGHGLRAGLATMLLKAEYEGVKRGPNPAAVLRELNSRIVGTYRSSALTMTACCLDLDLTTGHAIYAAAAHPSIVVVRSDGAEELKTGGTLIGLVPDLDIYEGTTRVERGEGVYAYTDGITEAASPTQELFGEERLVATLRAAHPEGTAVRALEKAAVAFTSGGGFSDDATIVGVARDP